MRQITTAGSASLCCNYSSPLKEKQRRIAATEKYYCNINTDRNCVQKNDHINASLRCKGVLVKPNNSNERKTVRCYSNMSRKFRQATNKKSEAVLYRAASTIKAETESLEEWASVALSSELVSSSGDSEENQKPIEASSSSSSSASSSSASSSSSSSASASAPSSSSASASSSSSASASSSSSASASSSSSSSSASASSLSASASSSSSASSLSRTTGFYMQPETAAVADADAAATIETATIETISSSTSNSNSNNSSSSSSGNSVSKSSNITNSSISSSNSNNSISTNSSNSSNKSDSRNRSNSSNKSSNSNNNSSNISNSSISNNSNNNIIINHSNSNTKPYNDIKSDFPEKLTKDWNRNYAFLNVIDSATSSSSSSNTTRRSCRDNSEPRQQYFAFIFDSDNKNNNNNSYNNNSNNSNNNRSSSSSSSDNNRASQRCCYCRSNNRPIFYNSFLQGNSSIRSTSSITSTSTTNAKLCCTTQSATSSSSLSLSSESTDDQIQHRCFFKGLYHRYDSSDDDDNDDDDDDDERTEYDASLSTTTDGPLLDSNSMCYFIHHRLDREFWITPSECLYEQFGTSVWLCQYAQQQQQPRQQQSARRLRQDNENIVMKIIEKSICLPDKLIRFSREVEFLSRINHPHILTFLSCIDSINEKRLFLEFGSLGDLHKCTANKILPEDVVRWLIFQIVFAVHSLHTKFHIIHSDIKPQNILRFYDPNIYRRYSNPPPSSPSSSSPSPSPSSPSPSSPSPSPSSSSSVRPAADVLPTGIASSVAARDYVQQLDSCISNNSSSSSSSRSDDCVAAADWFDVCLKVGDFGLAQEIQHPDESFDFHELVGTSGYFAPELLARKEYDCKVDIWAVGIMAFKLIGGYDPFHPASNCLEEDVEFEPRYWSKVSDDCKNFIRGLLERSREKRLSSTEALKHEWMRPYFDHLKISSF